MLQTNDSVYETATQQSIDFDVNELLNDAENGSSIEPVKVVENTLKKIHVNMLRLLFIIPQTNKIKESVDAEISGLESKLRNHNMNSFRTLKFLLLYDSELIIEWFVFTRNSATTHWW